MADKKPWWRAEAEFSDGTKKTWSGGIEPIIRLLILLLGIGHSIAGLVYNVRGDLTRSDHYVLLGILFLLGWWIVRSMDRER